MAYSLKLLLITFLLTCSIASALLSRPVITNPTLAVRLRLDEESPSCWDSLIHLQSCISNVILFFLNGETYLGPSCCHAIHIIEHQCWPSMLSTLGFTPQEGDIVRGYCDATADSATSPPLVTTIASHNLIP